MGEKKNWKRTDRILAGYVGIVEKLEGFKARVKVIFPDNNSNFGKEFVREIRACHRGDYVHLDHCAYEIQ